MKSQRGKHQQKYSVNLVQKTKLQKILIFFGQSPALCKYQVYHGYSKKKC